MGDDKSQNRRKVGSCGGNDWTVLDVPALHKAPMIVGGYPWRRNCNVPRFDRQRSLLVKFLILVNMCSVFKEVKLRFLPVL